jgi:hypothetical protein
MLQRVDGLVNPVMNLHCHAPRLWADVAPAAAARLKALLEHYQPRRLFGTLQQQQLLLRQQLRFRQSRPLHGGRKSL